MSTLPVDPQTAILALGAFASAAALTTAFSPAAGRGDRRRARFEAIAGAPARNGKAAEESRRRKVVEDTLKEIEATQKSRARNGSRAGLVIRLRQAGLGWSKRNYIGVAAGIGLTVALLVVFAGLGLLPAVGFGIAAGLLLPHLYVTYKRNCRFRAFTAGFPDAVDLIVRGVKAGLPLVDCLKVIAAEAEEPVRTEFATMVQDQMLGIPLDQAVQRLANRIPLPEASFFAIVIAMQSRSGGNLSEALGNLSKVLRERRKMKAKIQAMSMEAKASAGIIASMPVAVSILIYLTSPDYMELLFFTEIGRMVLAACMVWMGIGVLIMRKMINFDF